MQRIWRPRASVLEMGADGERGVTSDPGVDLVEHEQRLLRPGADRAAVGDAQQREHHARELAARRRSRCSGAAGTPAFGAIISST